MRKSVHLLLCVLLICLFTGCGEEKISTFTKTSVMDDVSAVESITLKAKGDIMLEMCQRITFDFSALEPEVAEKMIPIYDEMYKEMKASAPSCVTVTYGKKGIGYEANIKIPLENADLQALSDSGFLTMSGTDTSKIKQISYKQTCDAYIASGFSLEK